MPEPWIAVEAGHRRSRKIADLPNDSARYGWFVALGECKLLYQAGSFTPGQWRALMGAHARFLAAYRSVGLIHVAPTYCDDTAVCMRGRGPFPTGQLVIHNWSKYQREHAARQADYRAASNAQSDVGSDVLSDVETDAQSDAGVTLPHAGRTHGVAVPVFSRRNSTKEEEPYQVGNGLPNVDQETAAVGEGITGHGFLSAGAAQMTELDRLCQDHGAEAVRGALVRAAASRQRSWRQLVWDAVKVLEPFDAPTRMTPKQNEEAQVEAIVAKFGRRP